MAEALWYVHSRKRFLRFQLLFPDFYQFHHVIWGMKWAKMLKTKNGQNMSFGPFSHDAAHMFWFPQMDWAQLLPGFQLPVPLSKHFLESEMPIFFHGMDAIWTKFFLSYSYKPGPGLVLTSTIFNSAACGSFVLV